MHHFIAKFLLGLAAVVLVCPAARAAFIINFEQDGSNVVATGSGSFDIIDLTGIESQNKGAGAFGASDYLVLGSGNYNWYSNISGPSSFGTAAPASHVSSTTGDIGGIDAVVDDYGDLDICAKRGYVSGTAFTDSATWDNTTIAKLGLTPGSYVYTWGTDPDADSLTINVPSTAVPEPASLAAIGIPAAMTLLRRRRRAI
jgi:hypothetical protein